ncbi:MAG: signal peptidase I [Ardenticatenales bacterium]|nr:signal peptidase I [Ardenticatenales bacterium]
MWTIVGSFCLCFPIIYIVFGVALWKVFVKAEQPGWAGIIPYYNLYIITQISGREVWWLIVYFFIPPLAMVDLALSFGKSMVYGIVMGLIGIPLLMLGFGGDQYVGPVMKGKAFY